MMKDNRNLYDNIHKGGRAREKALKKLYYNKKCRNAISYFIENRGGNKHDVQDMFQEALITLDRKVRRGEFKGNSSIQTYLVGIAKYKWLNRHRKSKKTKYVDEMAEYQTYVAEDPNKKYLNKEQRSVLKKVTSSLDKACRKVLKLWKLSYSMREIAEKCGFSSDTYARKKKYRCMKKLMKQIECNSNFSEYFKEKMA